MKIGLRKPSIKKRLAARTSFKRYVRHSLGVKAPRGMGWITNPKKAAYNRVYNRTTFSVDKLFGAGGRSRGGDAIATMLVVALLAGAIYLAYWLLVGIIHLITYGINQIRKYSRKTPLGTTLQLIGLESSPTGTDIEEQPQDRVSIDSIAPNCPSCEQAMVKRMAKRGRHSGSEFWGCSTFPRCRGTRSA